MADQEMAGKVVVITGASSGIGKGTARKFAETGAFVVAAARREELLEELARECAALGGRALAMHTDVSKAENVEQLARRAVSTFSRIDVWINNTGSGTLGRFEEVPLSEHVQVIETDMLGTLYGSYYAMKQFHKQKHGTLLNVSSVLGKIPAPYYASYAAAKHGVAGLDGALRQELAVNNIEGIHVCTVYPMAMDTLFFEHFADHTGHKAMPIPPVYDPQEVVDTLYRLVKEPEDEVAVGGMSGPGTLFAHRVAPAVVEKALGKLIPREQMEKADLAPDISGSLSGG